MVSGRTTHNVGFRNCERGTGAANHGCCHNSQSTIRHLLNFMLRGLRTGRRIAFTAYTPVIFSMRTGSSKEIYVMNVDGTGVIRLTDDRREDVHPAWSPDGRRIAFASDFSKYSVNRAYRIRVINADGSGARSLRDDDDEWIYGNHPSWSPDGRYIAYDGPGGIFVTSADGGGTPVQLTYDTKDREPAWSPVVR